MSTLHGILFIDEGSLVSTNLEKLLVIQDRDRRISRLERETADIPARKKLIETRLEEHRNALHKFEEEIKKKNLALKELEAEVKAAQDKIAKFREQQFQVKSNDDYRALESQIKGVEQDIGKLEDRELSIMEEVEALRGHVALHDQRLKEEEQGVRQETDQLDHRAVGIQKEIDELRADRTGLAADVSADWLQRYERIFKHTGDFAIVKVDGGICGGCHMKLPPQTAHDARKFETMTLCSYCGRMLYFAG